MARQDTIAAVATPPGRGGIGVVRVSGPDAAPMARSLIDRVPPARFATLAEFRAADGEVLDTGIVLYFPGPDSFTGEDVLELHGHGGPVVQRRLLDRVCALGARLARPGEFTERAFLNDKLDLAQAEAVADLIDSASTGAARSAMRSLSGEFSRRVRDIDQRILALRVYLEAAMDFADEDIDFMAEDDVRHRARHVRETLDDLLDRSRKGQVLREGVDVVIAGAPNAGKSSLLNQLLAQDRAIVTDIPGTTRDLLSADIELAGVPVRLTDTAGLRAGGDQVEMIGVDRARAALDAADVVLLVEDATLGSPAELGVRPPTDRTLTVRNKVDLTGDPPGGALDDSAAVFVSAKTGVGVDALRDRLGDMVGAAPAEGVFLARERHLTALTKAGCHVAEAERRVCEGFGDLAAEELRAAQDELGGIVGTTSVEYLLGEIFSRFCVGK